MQKIIYVKNQLNTIASSILAQIPDKSIICFSGSMGAGKTTLIKALVKALGGADPGHSPTFGLVNEYHYPNDELLGYHFDFYRLNNPEEAMDIGLEAYWEQDGWFFIEWPEKIGALLPEPRIEITLNEIDPHTRELTLKQVNSTDS
jgi:tRNA threonylcarbamoyladenosine biosynthesis protein TsaE